MDKQMPETEITKVEPKIRKLPDNIKVYDGDEVRFSRNGTNGTLIAHVIDAFGEHREATIDHFVSFKNDIITCMAKDNDPELPDRYYALEFGADDRCCWSCVMTSDICGSKDCLM